MQVQLDSKKYNSVLGSPSRVSGMKVEQGESVIWLPNDVNEQVESSPL